MDEPWAEGEEGENTQAKDSIAPTDESDRPSDSPDDGEVRIKTEPVTDAQDNDEEMSPKGADDEDEGNSSPKPVIKTEEGDENSPVTLPKSRKDNSSENRNKSSGSEKVTEGKASRSGNMEQPEKRVAPSRSRGSNVGDSSELEASETEETDERRISSRRDQDCGSSSRSRTPDRPGSDFGGSPGPFTAQQQQQFLQAGIPYLHLLPPHIRNGKRSKKTVSSFNRDVCLQAIR